MKALLKSAREYKGLKTLETARLLKIDGALISKFESGQRIPTKSQLIQLADLYEIDQDQLVLLWLKEKVLRLVSEEALGLQALEAAVQQLNPTATPPNQKAIDTLFEEMDVLRNKMETLRKK